MPKKINAVSKSARHKKRKPRTEVSTESDSEPEGREEDNHCVEKKLNTADESKPITDGEISATFSKVYQHMVTTEFSNDIELLRSADDFNDTSIPILINALQQGTSLFTIEEQRRVVLASLKNDKKQES
ncbi:putative ribosome assembly protein 3 protein [Golovinomyces cichoracearum]|uniref:Ribosome assembly protein 3 n=1 Tax=Golovinomyces cichoracearum TaxID=62708 RepID=A0A420IZG2_9PEZI|nr:putative ribosome assembly protein 3 protein [Golovinomyces cichoracearum]